MARDLLPDSGLIHDFVIAHEDLTEAPRESFVAAGLALLAACVGPQLRIPVGFARDSYRGERCNLFVGVIGPSAIVKKSTVIAMARDVVADIRSIMGNIDSDLIRIEKVMATRVTDAGFAKMLGTDDVSIAEEYRRTRPPGWFIDADECAPLFGSENGSEASYTRAARDFLLSAYMGEISSTTSTTSIVPTPTSPTLLGAMTRANLLRANVPAAAQSGFFGRWVLFEASPSGKSIAVPSYEGTPPNLDRMAHTIGMLMRDGGVCENVWYMMTTEARQMWDDWYSEQHPKWERRALEAERGDVERIAGLEASCWSRWQFTTMKVAALHALSRHAHNVERLDRASEQWAIEPTDIQWALARQKEWMRLLHRLLLDGRQNPTWQREHEERVLLVLADSEHGILSQREILRGVGIDAAELQRIVIHNGDLGITEAVPPGKRKPTTVVWLTERWSKEQVERGQTTPIEP